MKKKTYIIIIFYILSLSVLKSQEMNFVKDSIMQVYMKNGLARKKFRPVGLIDENKRYQGKWKNYETVKDKVYISINGATRMIPGNYLIYSEGIYNNSRRVGEWKFYIIEDKSFKKILHQKSFFKKDKKNGKTEYYYPSGKIAFSGMYIDNKLVGNVYTYYEKGKIHGLEYYFDGLKTDIQNYYFPNGKLMFDQSFLKDTLNGKCAQYYPDGKTKEIRNYKMGKLDGVYNYFYSNGQLWVEKVYKKGLLIEVTGNYSLSGNKNNKGTIQNGSGTVKHYTENGKLYNIQTYRDGKLVKDKNL